jgi:glutaredoxin 3
MADDIIVYSGIHCAPCEAVKALLKEKGFSYTEKNINKDKAARQELRDMGMVSIPVTVIGDHRIQGFEKEQIEVALGLRQPA